MTAVRLQRVGNVGLVYEVSLDDVPIGHVRRVRGTWSYSTGDMAFRPAGGRREDAVACLLEHTTDCPPCEQPNAHRAGTCYCVTPEEPVWVRRCGHPNCVITAQHHHGEVSS